MKFHLIPSFSHFLKLNKLNIKKPIVTKKNLIQKI
jgi:hypothetical protein